MGAEAIRAKLLGKFREVTEDRIERLVAALGALASDRAGEALEEIARELHTLKGEAGMMGFVALSRLVHLLEDRLAAADAAFAEGLQAFCDALPHLLREDPAGGPLGQALSAKLEAAPPAEAAADTATEASGESPPEDSFTEGREAPEDAAPEAPAAPAPAAAAKAAPQPSDFAATKDAAVSSIRVQLDALDEIAGLAGDISVEGARSGARVGELRGLLEGWNRLADSLIHLAERRDASDAERRLVDEVETEVHKLRNDAFRFYHRHADSVEDVRRLLVGLSERIAEARLIPLNGVFAGLPEAARRLAAEHGKRVRCIITGGRTGVDKSILPSLSDPLVHLLRNAIDHGLETPEERRAVGKEPEGTVRISARAQGDRLQVILEDDGRGIDPTKLRAAAVRQGLMGEAEAASLNRRALLDLIFHQGLSTRAETTETSGRGVGLDVVRSRVASWGGTVEVESAWGEGTRFILELPQSLTLMKVLLFRVDEDVFGVPAADVEGVGRIEAEDIEEIAGIRAVRYRERLLPIVALGPLFALNGGPSGRRPTAVFLRQGSEGAAVVVDGFVGDRDVTVKAPGAFLRGMRFLSGAAAMEDGRVALLLSTSELLEAARTMGRKLSTVRSKRRLKVLLVDDSLIAREAEAALLRAEGHEVVEAGDGEEAWQKLQVERFDLLVTDVQMPVLDGIDLTRRVRAAPKLRKLPVAILSSLSAPQDRRRGVEAGADAYLGKSELNADTLGEMIERLCGTGS